MELCIGTKKVLATPMTRQQYNDYRGWEMPEDETDDVGYLVEYLDGGTSNHENHEGYISWSPSEVFHKAYSGVEYGVTMGEALVLLKDGERVARKGWNGKGMFLYLVPANTYPAQTNAAKKHIGDEVEYGAYIAMRTATGQVVPWLASQTDLLAEDWVKLPK